MQQVETIMMLSLLPLLFALGYLVSVMIVFAVKAVLRLTSKYGQRPIDLDERP